MTLSICLYYLQRKYINICASVSYLKITSDWTWNRYLQMMSTQMCMASCSQEFINSCSVTDVRWESQKNRFPRISEAGVLIKSQRLQIFLKTLPANDYRWTQLSVLSVCVCVLTYSTGLVGERSICLLCRPHYFHPDAERRKSHSETTVGVQSHIHTSVSYCAGWRNDNAFQLWAQ